jgi:hypothetical protein
MRILLATAVAIAPLLAATGAMAEVVISTSRTTPITTSNPGGAGPDSIRIGNNGVVSVTSGTAVTVDTSHNFTLEGTGGIAMANTADNSIGVQVNPGLTSTLNITSTITLTDSITEYPDSDNDGDIDGPWATGTGRYGIRYAAGAPVTGDLLMGAGGIIRVEGNDSYGVSIESGLNGKVLNQGVINVFGNNTIGFRTTGPITGTVTMTGAITARGENATAVSIGGDVDGRLTFQGDISSSGYRYTARGNDAFEGRLDAEDKLQGGSTVIIAGDIGGGVVFDRPPTDADPANADEDADGLPDGTEPTALITSYGEAAAVVVGSDARSITLGAVGTGTNAFGFINRGTINGLGVYDNINANGVLFGGNAGQTVTIDGGIRNEGIIATLAIRGDSTAIHVGDGTITPQIYNSGTITAGISSDIAVTGTAILIDDDADVTSFVNEGSILASASGGRANVTALMDASGELTEIINRRSLQANLSTGLDGVRTGSNTAIDVTANTTGVTLMQEGITGTPTASNPDTDGDGVPNGSEPIIAGDIRFGSGGDFMDIRNGQVLGDVAFGDGADRLDITGGALVRGSLSDTDNALDINITDGTLDSRQTTALTVSSLNIGADGDLLINLDPAAGNTGGFIVTGNANIATGGGLGLRFSSLLNAPTTTTPAQRFNLIDAGTLTLGTPDLSGIADNSPFLYVVEAGVDAPNSLVFADVRRRTADEAEMIASEAAMYDSFYAALGGAGAADMRNAFLAQTGREDFINLYEQLLPDHSGGPLVSLASGVDAVTRALTGRNASAAPGETSAWMQEISFYADKERTDTYGFRSEGFGVAGGVERGTDLGAVGLTVAFTSSDLEDPESEAEEVLSANLLELGLYWRAQGQYWTTWARAAAGYATLESERRFVGAGLNLTNTSDWNGFSLAAAGGASYERNFGRFSVRPEVYAEYFSLSEDGHVEEGGGDGFDLEIDDRDGHLFSATAAVNIGMTMGESSWLRPELRVGWRQNISVDPGETIARFRSGSPDFILAPDTIEGGGPILGFRLNVGNERGMLSVSADAEMLEDYVRYMLFLRASFRF